jgi:hypothetical protein
LVIGETVDAQRYAEMNGSTVVNVTLATQATATQRGWLGPVPSNVGAGWTTPDGGQTWQPGTPPVSSDQANSTTIRDALAQALVNNRTFIDATKPATATAQASAAYDAAVRQARQINALIRLLLGLLDGTE